MAMAPIDEEGNEKDMKSGIFETSLLTSSPNPNGGMEMPPRQITPITPRRIITNSGRTLALSNSAKRADFSTPHKNLASRSFPNLQELEAETCSNSSSPPVTPFTPSRMILTNAGKAIAVSSSGKHLGVSCSSKSLSSPKCLVSISGKRFDQNQRKMYLKQVTGKHNDTELHLMAKRGNLEAVAQILKEIDEQMTGMESGVEFDAELDEIRTAIVNEVNELGETPMFAAAEKGHLDVVKALLPHMTREGILAKNQAELDAFHVAAAQGHEAIVRVLLDYDPGLCKTFSQSNATPLISAATRGHLAVVQLLMEKDSSLVEATKKNGKNALHFAVRQGHADITKALITHNPQLARKTDKKGQTPLHMAVKGNSSYVVRLLLKEDPATVILPDRFGNTVLHIATRKKRTEIVKELLSVPETNVNALTSDNKTALDIVDGLPFSEEASDIKVTLIECGAVKANDMNRPKDELNQTMNEIQRSVLTQLEQTRRTNRNMDGIAKEVKKLHREAINNAANSVTVVAVLFATVAFTALFTVPGGNYPDGTAVVASYKSFKIFFISNAVALFTSLSVVVVQITLVRGETKAERRVVEVINKMMWLASVCTSVAFMSSSYIVVGKRNRLAAILVTVLGGVIMAGVLGTMSFYVVKSKRIRKVRRKQRSVKNARRVPLYNDLSDAEAEINPIYAI
ncbi:hypothetical protein V2J09_010415 [Rumex salicifolius]